MKPFLGCLVSVFITSLAGASTPPKIRVLDVPSKTSVGEEAALTCSLGLGTKPVQFIWTKDGQEVPSKLVTSLQTTSTIVIPVVKLEDRGRYSCKIKSSFGEDVKSADLVVSGEPFEARAFLSTYQSYPIRFSRSTIILERTTRCKWCSRTRGSHRVQSKRRTGASNQVDKGWR
jgi:hypothetical protein